MISQTSPESVDQSRTMNAAERAAYNAGVRAVVDMARIAAITIETGERSHTSHIQGAAVALASFAEAAQDLRLERPDFSVARMRGS